MTLYSKNARDKIETVMHEFKLGELKSGKGGKDGIAKNHIRNMQYYIWL